ncbi:endonuclease/exonuclease/phosphatase family protein [Ideonella sp.]|uniref:endonuclease/exonuclease/phosphatase family protein n=1 Tax=Ideonella sp. TaxID=1929293 RepID=UPI0035B35B28
MSPATPPHHPHPSTTPAPARPALLRVLTVNTHKGFTLLNRRFVLPELRDAVRTVNADVVFLQEVQGEYSHHAAVGASWPQAPHYEFLADEIWPQFAYGRNAVYQQGDHGNAVLSKYPIVGQLNHDVSLPKHEARGLLHCLLDVPGRGEPVHAISVHLGLAESHRRHQLELLCGIVDQQIPPTAALLVAGDFNDWRNKAHQVLGRCAGLQEVFVQAHGSAAKTFPARFPLLPLDRIYVRNVRAHRPVALPRFPWSHLSDHAPLAAEIML